MAVLVAILLKLVGVGFLVVATIGVIRFSDPFQRMHAATKAGTLGAGLVLVGAMITKGTLDAAIVASLSIVFLLASMPVAGHLLGRAAYISGAPLRARGDALAGVLPRESTPLEQREDVVPPVLARAALAPEDLRMPAAPPALRLPEPTPAADVGSLDVGFDRVRFAVIAPHAGRVARRARALALAERVPLAGIAVIDRSCVEDARAPDAGASIRACLAEAVLEVRGALEGAPTPVSLSYEEGDPLDALPSPTSVPRDLLLLPTDGWCHHGARVTIPVFEQRQADKLFVVAERHAGPTLFVGEAEPKRGRVCVVHDGEERVQRLAAWAIASRIWQASTVTVVGRASPEQIEALEAVAADVGAAVEHVRAPRGTKGALMPDRWADAVGVVLPALPSPQRVCAYDSFWQDRLAPGFRGDVLV